MRSFWTWGLAVLPVVLVSGLVAFATLRPVTVLPRQGLAPGFVLTGADGMPVTSEALRGSVLIYSFATDPAAANPALDLARDVRQRWAEVDAGAPPVRLITIDIDGVTPHAGSVGRGVDQPRWDVLTSDPATLKRVVGTGFGVYYDSSGGAVTTVEPALALVDGWGIIRAEYRRPLPAAAEVLRDLRLVTDEARQSDGLARYAYEAAHLFACYPR